MADYYIGRDIEAYSLHINGQAWCYTRVVVFRTKVFYRAVNLTKLQYQYFVIKNNV